MKRLFLPDTWRVGGAHHGSRELLQPMPTARADTDHDDWSTFSRSPTEKKVTLAACRLALSARLSGEYATSVASWRVPSTPDAIIPPYKKMRMNVRVLGVSAFGTTIATKRRDSA